MRCDSSPDSSNAVPSLERSTSLGRGIGLEKSAEGLLCSSLRVLLAQCLRGTSKLLHIRTSTGLMAWLAGGEWSLLLKLYHETPEANNSKDGCLL